MITAMSSDSLATGLRYRTMTIPTTGAPASGGNAMTLIASQINISSQSAVVFANIPQTFKHLQLRVTMRDQYANTGIAPMNLYLNTTSGALSTSYYSHWLKGNTTTVSSTASNGSDGIVNVATRTSANDTASVYAASIVDILDYTNASKLPILRGLTGGYASAPAVQLASGFLNSAGSVTQIILTTTNGAKFDVGARVSLYGISG